MNNELEINFIAGIKAKVRQAQYDALKVVNVHLINLYREIGKSISEKQSESWGKAIVPTLSKELQKEFPGVGGFSVGNLWLKAQFYNEYHNVEKGLFQNTVCHHERSEVIPFSS